MKTLLSARPTKYESQRVARWRKANPEKLKKQKDKYYEKKRNDPVRWKEYLNKKKKWDKAFIERKKAKGLPIRKTKYILSEEQKQRKIEYDKIWKKNNPEKAKLYYRKTNFKRQFGSIENREAVIKRDGNRCVKCGITREEHRIKYKRDITLDHINRMGRGVSKELKDNRMENLQTLCISCHMKKDGKQNARTR